jgi:hypothetical protein
LSTYCPICNGFQTLAVACPNCRAETADYGRYNDYLGPYSPYRPIDDISMTNGYPDVANHICLHLMGCSTCNQTFQVGVKELS